MSTLNVFFQVKYSSHPIDISRMHNQSVRRIKFVCKQTKFCPLEAKAKVIGHRRDDESEISREMFTPRAEMCPSKWLPDLIKAQPWQAEIKTYRERKRGKYETEK